MSRRPVVIDQFRDLPRTAEIVGLGGVHQPFGGAQEVEVAVLLATDMDGPGFDANADTRVLRLGCGQLDLLVAGSRWRLGSHVGQARVEMVTRTVHPTVPPQVEYALIDLGHSLSAPVIHLGQWAEAHIDLIEGNRSRYDAAAVA